MHTSKPANIVTYRFVHIPNSLNLIKCLARAVLNAQSKGECNNNNLNITTGMAMDKNGIKNELQLVFRQRNKEKPTISFSAN